MSISDDEWMQRDSDYPRRVSPSSGTDWRTAIILIIVICGAVILYAITARMRGEL
jgi:hypothetical protein